MGYEGKLYISNLLGISQKTIRKDDNELKNPDLLTQTEQGKQRRSGGGRIFYCSVLPDILSLLVTFIEEHKAGCPTDPNIFWTHLKPKEIALKFQEKHQIRISHGMIKRQLLAMNYKYRKLSKQLPKETTQIEINNSKSSLHW